MKRPPDDLVVLIKERSHRIRPVPAAAAERGSLPRRPRCVLFDVYGTLLVRLANDGPPPGQASRRLDELLRRRRLPVTGAELHGLLHRAIEKEHSVLRARGYAHPEVTIERIWASVLPGLSPAELRRLIVEYELVMHPAWPMPGCLRLLRSLARSGIVLGIASNAQFYTPLFLRALLGSDLENLAFSPDLCLYSCDLGIAKPDAAFFDRAVEKLRGAGISAGEAVMVGNDAARDIEPAVRAGFMTVHAALDRASTGAAPHGSGRSAPDAMIRRLASLQSLIRKTF